MAIQNQAMRDLLRFNAAMTPRQRSSFDKSHSHSTTLDSGFIIPVMWDRVLPGDEKKIRVSALARMATPLHPTMDQANLDIWCFYIPDRLWWNRAREFYGENKDAEFNPDGDYRMPSIKLSDIIMRGDFSDSLSDYIGIPFWDNGMSLYAAEQAGAIPEVCVGPWRCYQLIWNEWFRNSSIQPSLQLNDGSTVTSDEMDVILQLRKACKYPDYFTTLLRTPQSGEDVLLPLGDWAPVVTRDIEHASTNDKSANLKFVHNTTTGNANGLLGIYSGRLMDGQGSSSVNGSSVVPSNLWTDLTSATSATINNLRAAITVQHLLELQNVAGKRYQQILYATWGVLTGDSTLSRPELCGASRTSVGMRQVLQTGVSDSGDGSGVGNLGAFSLTNMTDEWICNKAFTEPGYLMVMAAVRPVMSYSQGIDPLLTKLGLYDHYQPVFDHLGAQPVYTYNIMGSWNDNYGTPEFSDFASVFGYASAWDEYRIKQNRVSGLMRPNVPNNLASWNYSEEFDSIPVLDSEFVTQNESLIDRTIAVKTEPQFILDCYFDYIDIKNMSVRSVPGLDRL